MVEWWESGLGPIGWGKAVRLAAWLLHATVKVAIGERLRCAPP